MDGAGQLHGFAPGRGDAGSSGARAPSRKPTRCARGSKAGAAASGVRGMDPCARLLPWGSFSVLSAAALGRALWSCKRALGPLCVCRGKLSEEALGWQDCFDQLLHNPREWRGTRVAAGAGFALGDLRTSHCPAIPLTALLLPSQGDWRPSEPSLRPSSVRRTWSSGWPARTSRGRGRRPSWPPGRTASSRNSFA